MLSHCWIREYTDVLCQNNEAGINYSQAGDMRDAYRGTERRVVSGSEVLTVIRVDHLTQTGMLPDSGGGFMADIRAANL